MPGRCFFTLMTAATAALFLLFTYSLPPLWAATGDVRVISSDDSGLTLELNVPVPDMEEVILPDGTFTRIRVSGWATTLEPGSPELPVKGFLIRAPASGSITVETTAESPTTVRNVLVSPVPTHSLSDDGTMVKEYETDEAVYGGEKGDFPGDVVTVERAGVVRGVPVARVTFRPFQWDPGTKELSTYAKITARIAFEEPLSGESEAISASADSTAPVDAFTGLLSGAFVNGPPVSLSAEPEAESAEPLESEEEAATDSATTTSPVKISVKQNGIYRVTYSALKKAGAAVASMTPATFRLLHKGTQVAVRVVTAGKKFASGDYIEFYGEGLDGTFSDTNAYWLYWGGAKGKRMAVLNGATTSSGKTRSAFAGTVHFEENLVSWGLTPGAPDSDYWFWEKITAPSTNAHTFKLSSVRNTSGTGTVQVRFRGRTTASPHPNHHTKILLNGTAIGDATWDGDGEHTQKMKISLSLLKEGNNTLSVVTPGDTGASVDQIYLNWFEVSYLRLFKAVNDQLAFPLTGTGRLRFTVKNLVESDVNVYDITSPSKVAIFSKFKVKKSGKRYLATVEAAVSGKKTFLAVGKSAVLSPSAIEVWTSPKLKGTTNGTDYILITARKFLASFANLTSCREAQGFRVKAVAVEDIYNEFNYGLTDPQAIKNFLKYAYAKWKRPAPTYVLLAGDATYDYRDYLGTGKVSVVPVHLGWTSAVGITPEDNWYVAVDGKDVLPDMLVGRIPVSNKPMAAYMANKIAGYEKATTYAPTGALFAADNDSASFEKTCENMVAILPSTMAAKRVYLSSYSSTAAATQDIIDGIDAGMMVTTYVGHGNVTLWAAERLFQSDNVADLSNGSKLTFVLGFDCLNGWFAYPYSYSLSETFVGTKGKGAIAFFSPSGGGYPSEYDLMGNAIFTSMFTAGNRVLGAITTGSRITAYGEGMSQDSFRTFILIGDPATTLKGGN